MTETMTSDKGQSNLISMPKCRSIAVRLMDQVHDVLRYHYYGYKTGQAYTAWIKRDIKFNQTCHPREMGKREIEDFLTHLAVDRHVASSNQKQALNTLVFLYKQVLDLPVPDSLSRVRTMKSKRLPVVLSIDEARLLLSQMKGVHKLMAQLFSTVAQHPYGQC